MAAVAYHTARRGDRRSILRRGAGAAFVLALAAALAVVDGALPAAAAPHCRPTPPLRSRGIAHWHEIGSYVESTLIASEGLATVRLPGGRTTVVYRGVTSVPPALAAEGWTHVGDPDSASGDIIDAYQGSSTSKMFLVTTPSGATLQYVHPLIRGELYNNSFAAIAPGEQWMVAGTWNTVGHLQVYPTPLLNRRTPPGGGTLHLAAFINLDHRVNDVQGCDFVDARTLVCASDDSSQRLFANPKPLLEVRLAHALDGRPVAGHVLDLGSIPQHSSCSGTFEAEGVDYDVTTGILRVEIIQPGSCILSTTVLEYVHRSDRALRDRSTTPHDRLGRTGDAHAHRA